MLVDGRVASNHNGTHPTPPDIYAVCLRYRLNKELNSRTDLKRLNREQVLQVITELYSLREEAFEMQNAKFARADMEGRKRKATGGLRLPVENPFLLHDLRAISPEVHSPTKSPPLTLRLVGLPAKKSLQVTIKGSMPSPPHEDLDVDDL